MSIAIAHPDKFYIGGAWVAPSSGSLFRVANCSTEEPILDVAEAQEDDIDRAVAAARAAFDQGPWPRMAPTERAVYLRRISQDLLAHGEDFARIWSLESGIVFKLARTRIGLFLNGAFNSYADMAATFPFEERRKSMTGNLAYLVREPVGVAAAIVPWNGPAGLMAYKCAPALLAGCTLVLKSSPEAPCSGYLFAEICEKAGLPPGVINVVTADRAVSEHLVRHPGIDKVTFTGSTAAGRKIASICGDRIARCTLELGGKSAAVVLDDYDVGVAARTIAVGSAYLSGQVCHSLTRVIVNRRRHDAMVEALAHEMQALRIGDPFDPVADMGPLASARQRDRVEGYVTQGARDGAQLATGGKRPADMNRGFFFEPTVFGHVDNRSVIAREEIFGPVLSVIPADDESQAVDLANDSPFGLNASVFTHDAERFRAVSRRLRTGTVGQNASRTDFSIAFGGFKQSGLGREGGVDGLMPFLEAKTVVLDAYPP